MLEKLSADVWFVFGSFVYGLEGRVLAWSGDTIEIHLLSSDLADAQGIAQFLDDLAAGSRGLVKSQISLYDDSNLSSSSNTVLLRLFTEISPTVRANSAAGSVLFSGVRGVTSLDHETWRKLVAGE